MFTSGGGQQGGVEGVTDMEIYILVQARVTSPILDRHWSSSAIVLLVPQSLVYIPDEYFHHLLKTTQYPA